MRLDGRLGRNRHHVIEDGPLVAARREGPRPTDDHQAVPKVLHERLQRPLLVEAQARRRRIDQHDAIECAQVAGTRRQAGRGPPFNLQTLIGQEGREVVGLVGIVLEDQDAAGGLDHDERRQGAGHVANDQVGARLGEARRNQRRRQRQVCLARIEVDGPVGNHPAVHRQSQLSIHRLGRLQADAHVDSIPDAGDRRRIQAMHDCQRPVGARRAGNGDERHGDAARQGIHRWRAGCLPSVGEQDDLRRDGRIAR